MLFCLSSYKFKFRSKLESISSFNKVQFSIFLLIYVIVFLFVPVYAIPNFNMFFYFSKTVGVNIYWRIQER